MKTLLKLAVLMALSAPAFAAGTCPSGANYLSLTSPQTGNGLGSVTLSSLGITSCYFVSAAGLDSNAGTTEGAPFLHAPGMPNFTGSATASTSTGIILRGGDTWHRSSGTPLMGGQWTIGPYGYVGIDLTWFSGGSFARPIVNMDNPLSTSLVSSCSFDDGAASALKSVSVASGTTLDGLEVTGSCSSGAGNGSYIYNAGGIIERCYAHGWTVTSSAIDDSFAMFDGAGTSTSARSLFDVEDGLDSSLGTTCTNTSCVGSGQATGWGMRDCWDVEFSIMRHSSQGAECNNLSIFRGNLFEYLFEPTVSSRHGNILEAIDGNSLFILSGNIIRNVNEGVGIWPVAGTIIEFNNTCENDQHFPPDENAFMMSPATNGQAGIAYFYNNTSDGTCASRAVGQSPAYGAGSTFNAGNNHILDRTAFFTGGSAFWACSAGAGNTCTNLNDHLGEVFQTTATANGQGYVLANDFSPTLGTNATVGAGVNQTSLFCPTVAGFNATAGTDCLSGTPKGVMEVAGWGGQMAIYPGTTVVARSPSDWDAGAYQFQSTQTLTVAASGSGLVTDNFSEISCPPTCSASYATSTVVTLTAIANIGSYFSGWSGSGCSGAFRCTITMSAAESVTATFSTIPPNRTDLTPENTTTTPPASIGTGFSGSTALPATDTSLTSGNYGRCTDGNWLNPTTGATTNGYRFSSGCGDSAECRAWSIDHQLLAVQDQGGGTEPAIFLGPNVAGLVCQRIATTSSTWSSSHGVRLLDSGEFSPSNARWFYYKSGTVSGGTSGQISVMDLTNFANQSTNPPVTLVMDMANGFTPGYATGGTAGTITYNEFSGVEGDNTSSARLAMNFSNNTGGQGTGYLLIVATGNFAGIVAGSVAATTIVYTTFDFSTNTKYSTSWSGSAWVQTNVGSITGDQPGIHNARLNRNGNYVYITATTANCIGSCAGSFYNIAVTGATLFETCTISNPCGHQAQGYGVVFGNGGNRTYAYGVTLPTYTTIAGIPGNGGPVGLNNCSGTYPGYSNAGSCNIATNDSHMNTDADTNGLDTALVGITTTTNTGPEPPWDEVNIGPYRNELFFTSPTTGTVYRSGHTFDSTTSPTSGQYAIGVPSTDQQFVAQMTDWYGGFGKNDNTGTNSCVSATDYWRASNTYAANVNVWIKSSGQNPGNFIFNTGAGGTVSASLPAMNQTLGGTTTDGSMTWTNANMYSCRTDVVIIQTVLPSSLSFPTFSRSGVMLQ